jgi:hypothetical protein
MRNTWKGMMLGALSGALVGLVLDSLDRAAQGAGSAVHAAPDAAAWAGGRARDRAFALVQDSAGFAHKAMRKAADRDGQSVGQ